MIEKCTQEEISSELSKMRSLDEDIKIKLNQISKAKDLLKQSKDLKNEIKLDLEDVEKGIDDLIQTLGNDEDTYESLL